MDSVARIISAYDSQGVHRTGTPVDEASAHWLADEIGRIGLAPTLMPFPLDRLDVATATVTINGEVFEGLPRFDGPGTETGGISGRLGPIDGDAEIGLLAAKAHSDERIETARNETDHKAIIHITEGAPPGLTPVNADAFSRPFGLPVLQVSNAHRGRLEAAAETNAEATVTIDVSRNPAQAFNVEASLDGRQPYLDPLVVMTPRSGWWQCASERGGGLVVFLEIMRTLSEAGSDRPVIFTANSGHELGHIGLDHFIDMHPDLVKSAAYWIHLGANFAAASGSNVCLQASDDALLNLGRSAMKEAGSVPDVETPLGQRPRGEARNIFDGGGKYISLLGTNGLFHHPHDRWPEAIDQEKTRRLARAFCGVAMALSED